LRKKGCIYAGDILLEIARRMEHDDHWYRYALRVGSTNKEDELFAALKKEWPKKWSSDQIKLVWQLTPGSAVGSVIENYEQASAEERKLLLDTIAFSGDEAAEEKIESLLDSENDSVVKEYGEWWVSNVRKLASPATPISQQKLVSLDAALKLKGNPQNGKALFEKLPCKGCHLADSGVQAIGPSIPELVAKNNKQQLTQNIIEPISAIMPSAAKLNLSEQDVVDLVAYLQE